MEGVSTPLRISGQILIYSVTRGKWEREEDISRNRPANDKDGIMGSCPVSHSFMGRCKCVRMLIPARLSD